MSWSLMSTGAWVLLAATALAIGLGLWRAGTDGRFRGIHALKVKGMVERDGGMVANDRGKAEHDGGVVDQRVLASVGETPRPSVLSGTPWESQRGERATLVQFSSAFCAPCRSTRHVLAEVAAGNEGVAHIEVDAESHLDMVRRLGILRTPTTLVLDADGLERRRATGAPRREQVESELDAL